MPPAFVSPSIELDEWLKNNLKDGHHNIIKGKDVELETLLALKVPNDILKTSLLTYRYNHSCKKIDIFNARKEMELNAYRKMFANGIEYNSNSNNNNYNNNNTSIKDAKKDIDKLMTLLFQTILSSVGVFVFIRQFCDIEKSLLISIIIGTILLGVEIFLIF